MTKRMLTVLCLLAAMSGPLAAQNGFLLIDKRHFTLSVVDSTGYIEKSYGIACGQNYGNKTRKGDHKTPEGTFRINELLNSRHIPHDFGDGKGPIQGAYGPWFLRLDVPGTRVIGIHGTHLPESIGTRSSEGCIRMRNEDIVEVKERVCIGFPVTILPDFDTVPNPDTIGLRISPRDSCTYDVYLCYGERNRAKALSLQAMLDSAGLKTALDPAKRELSPTLTTRQLIADSRVLLIVDSTDARHALSAIREAGFAGALASGPEVIVLASPGMEPLDYIEHYVVDPGALIPWLRIKLSEE